MGHLVGCGSSDHLMREVSLVRGIGDLVVGIGLIGVVTEPTHGAIR